MCSKKITGLLITRSPSPALELNVLRLSYSLRKEHRVQ